MSEAANTLPTYENRGVERLLSMGNLFIDFNFGITQLNQYLADLSELKSGVPYASLGISERRQSTNPYLISNPGTAKQDTISDPYILRNQSLTAPGSIAVVKLEGVMTAQDGISNYGIGRTITTLRSAFNNRNISSVIMETNSGGGQATAMFMITSALSERNKPVVTFGHYAASAAYGAASATDEIVASGKNADFGSIGAMWSIDMEFLAWYKETFQDFYGKDAPRKNEELRGALENNFKPIQDSVDQLTVDFHNMVKANRPLTGQEAYQKTTLSGAMFSAEEAKRRGLIDGIGNMDYAIKRALAWADKY